MAMTQTVGDVGASRGAVAAACLFHGLGDASRVAILRELALGERRVVDLTVRLGLAQSTVSQHLACLRDCGLVTCRPVGRASVWSLAHPQELDAVWAAAQVLLGLTAEQMVACPRHGATVVAGGAR